MSLPKYIINFDELTEELKKEILRIIDEALRNKYPEIHININNIEALLEELKSLLPSVKYEKLKKKIDDLVYSKCDGKQKAVGKLLDIPAIKNSYKEEFIFDKDVFLTGLHFNQTGWKKEDTFDLIINKNKIIDNATIKEIGEHKYFNTYFKVNAKTPIFFILNNNSGNSRQTMLDLEYIEGIGTSITVKPPVISIEDITNDWDIAVVLDWEADTRADMDLHGFIGNEHVFYGHKEYDNFYLNFDYRQHEDNKNPEILSVKGHKNKTLKIYINNFNKVNLREQVNIKIYAKRAYGSRLLKEFNIDSIIDRDILQAVCEINLSTLKIKSLFENIRR